MLMRALVDHVEVTAQETGTVVTLSQRLRRPVEFGAATSMSPPSSAEPPYGAGGALPGGGR
jgi:hypothetical protein